GLYASMNAAYLRRLGAGTILGGEFEAGLLALAERLAAGRGRDGSQPEPLVSLARQSFLVPDRSGLPELGRYAQLHAAPGDLRTVGYTEASRGCKHLCRHCPIVPVYEGRFRIVEREVVLADIERQVAAGARHVTFGDPDFWNGPTHAMNLVRELHARHPDVTYDVTIKVEHLLRHAEHLPTLRDTGCLFVTSAVESVDDRVLQIFAKGHTRQDFIAVAGLFRAAGLQLNPTFVTFTPWITAAGYRDLLQLLEELDLVGQVAPIQYAIRLLIPQGSKLLDLAAVCDLVEEFDEERLVYPWRHPEPRVDELCAAALQQIQAGQDAGECRHRIFARVWRLADAACEESAADGLRLGTLEPPPGRMEVPYLTEPWYC
ncbi:MAG TPA: radical SAM protein, partial [Thermoanaerobaculia bacterium]